jgi:4-aminobutyrate aminotransferase/(S)-3-amino-2-methylpropionate transaminase
VETAIKTALMATGRSTIISFVGAYHGTFGLALAATHRAEFRSPFAAAYNTGFVRFCPWGEIPQIGEEVACVIVEPWQGRAGVVPPPDGFLEELRAACTNTGALLVVDSVLVGSGRAGTPMLGAELAPDILCLGKALGAGAAVSATVCTEDVAERAWGQITGEAIHTSTFLADPIACTALISACAKSRETDWATFDQRWRVPLTQLAADRGYELRGRGLVWALDTGEPGAGFAWSQDLLSSGVVVVPSGPSGESITLLPSTITDPVAAANHLT